MRIFKLIISIIIIYLIVAFFIPIYPHLTTSTLGGCGVFLPGMTDTDCSTYKSSNWSFVKLNLKNLTIVEDKSSMIQ
jgi:hypothetical protein